MNIVFSAGLFAGSALIGCWIAVRFPQLAPRSLMVRCISAAAISQVLSFTPVSTDSYFALYGSVFAVLLPMLTVVWLQAVWLLMGLRDLVTGPPSSR